MIDAHIHADTRPYEDFEMMNLAGIEAAISCAHDPLRMSSSDVIFDHFQRISEVDVQRARQNGLDLYVALGIHPRSISNDFELVLEKLPNLLENRIVVAIGEIGLENDSKSEKEVFRRQLMLAEELKLKVVVHTPRINKNEITKIIISIIEENIDPSLVLIDHVNKLIIDEIIDFGALLGLTVQPTKMTVEQAILLANDYGYEKFVLNSDMSSSPSDPLSVPKTVHKMKLSGIKKSNIQKISSKNALEFFKL
jgi:uncharacterized protein